MFGNKVYTLPLSKDYVRHWGVVEAVRELLQNALDSKAPFEYTFVGQKLVIYSAGIELDPSTLLLGVTTKEGDDHSIGSFGEGYKIAMLVLTRCNRSVTVYNASKKWRPFFEMCKDFNAEVLKIEESKLVDPQLGLTFTIDNLTLEEIDAIKSSCLHMQEAEVGYKVPMGTILLEHSKKLYVNGLFVCDTKLEFGYNVKPEYLKLERDRQTVSTFDLLWITKQMWFDAHLPNKVAELMEANCPDLQYAEYSTPELVKEACYRLFKEKYPGAIAAKSQKEMDSLVAKGMTNTKYVNDTFYTGVTSSSSYQAEKPRLVAEMSPHEALVAWFKANKKYMRKHAIVSCKTLITKAEDWRTNS